MEYKVWDFENDYVVTDRPLLFPEGDKKAINYMGSAYAVDAENGVFFHRPSKNGKFDLWHIDENGLSLALEDICVIASDMKYSCIIIYSVRTGEVFLLDTRGEFYLLEVIEKDLFLNPAQYDMRYNKDTYFYEVGNRTFVKWHVRGISKEAAIKKMLRKRTK